MTAWKDFVNGVKRLFRRKSTYDKIRGAAVIGGTVTALIGHIL